MKQYLSVVALVMLGLGPPEETHGQTAGGYPFEVRAINLENNQEVVFGMNSEKEAEDYAEWLRNYKEPPYVKGFANVKPGPNRSYGRNPLISNRATGPSGGNYRPPGPWILDQRRLTLPAATPSPTPAATPVSLPARSPVNVPVNPVIEQKLDQLRDTLLPAKPNSQIQPPGKTNRFGYDDTLAKSAPKGVLMRVGIDQTTLQSAQAAPKLLERIRK